MKKIQWNKVTWYSKLGAVIVVFIFLPLLSFYIGIQYEKTYHIEVVPKIITDRDIESGIATVLLKDHSDVRKINHEKYELFKGKGMFSIVSTTRGDINEDAVEDVFIEGLWCAASCGKQFIAILASTTPVAFSVTPKGIETAGYKQVTIDNIIIFDNMINMFIEEGTKKSAIKYKLNADNMLQVVK